MSETHRRVTLTGLFVYPVKGLRGISVTTADIDELGLVGDRRFMVVDENDRFVSQRTLPAMARIASALTADQLTLSTDGHGSVSVPRGSDPAAALRVVSVWKSEGLRAEDCGAGVADWLSGCLRFRCRLVRIGSGFERPILKPGKARPGDRVMFADAYPFLVVSEASVANLNDRLVARHEEPVPINRFRPNFVVSGCGAFEEDTWTEFTLGDVVFRAGGNCGRCPVTTVDQITGERGTEPLRTLAGFRRSEGDSGNVDFGQNLIHSTKSGRVNVGDQLKVG